MFTRLLNRLSKLTKTDMRYVARGSFWLSVNHVVTAGLGFILAVALANALPENVYGNYRYILSLSVVATTFSLTGLNLALIRDIARGVRGLLRNSFFTQLKWSLGTFFVSLGIASYYLIKGNIELALGALIMAVFLPLISSTHLYSAYWEGKKDYKRLSQYNIASTVIYSVSLFIIIQFTHYLPLIILGYFASQAFCSLLFFSKTLKDERSEESNIQKIETDKTINFSKHISFLNVLSTIAGQLDKILVFSHLGAVQLAVYSISQLPVSNIRAVFKQVTQLAYPKYSSKSITEIESGIYQKMGLLSIPIVVCVILYMVAAPIIFDVFFPKYSEAVLYSQISVLSLLFFQKKLIAYAVLSTGSKKHIYSMSIWASVFKISLLVILLPKYGIWGAIFAELIAQVTGFFTSILMLKHVSRDVG